MSAPTEELKRGGCTYIAGDPMERRPWSYCNMPVDYPGSSWCSEHRKIVFDQTKKPTGKFSLPGIPSGFGRTLAQGDW
jgi:hypothetical protein